MAFYNDVFSIFEAHHHYNFSRRRRNAVDGLRITPEEVREESPFLFRSSIDQGLTLS